MGISQRGAAMICHIYNTDGSQLLRTEEREPEHGEDFCDTCGDCLHCNGSDPCWPDGGTHLWVVYEGREEDERLPDVPFVHPIY